MLPTILLLPVVLAAPYAPGALPAATPASPYCNLTSSVTYSDQYAPVLSEYSYSCSLPPLPAAHPSRIPHPSHPFLKKATVHDTACAPLPHAARLSESRYSNLFWGIRALTNQSCIEPGQVKEYADIERGWSAEWRLTVVNRGEEKRCEWYRELGNIAEAMHYYCFYNGPAVVGEHSGGEESLVWGTESRDGRGGLRWCFRYSRRGWGEKMWEEKCLGIEEGGESAQGGKGAQAEKGVQAETGAHGANRAHGGEKQVSEDIGEL